MSVKGMRIGAGPRREAPSEFDLGGRAKEGDLRGFRRQSWHWCERGRWRGRGREGGTRSESILFFLRRAGRAKVGRPEVQAAIGICDSGPIRNANGIVVSQHLEADEPLP